MFDSIFLKVKCPFCGQTSEMEAQTKELECELRRYKVGGNIETPGTEHLECITECLSDECRDRAERRQGYRGGGSFFDIDIETPLGLITGKYKLVGEKFYYNV